MQAIALEILCQGWVWPLSAEFVLLFTARFRKMKHRAEAQSSSVFPGIRKGRLRRCMSIQNDRWIREQAINHWSIEPFRGSQVHNGFISYGLSSDGYGLRTSDEFKFLTNVNSVLIDRKAFDERFFVSVQAGSAILPPNSFASARTTEYFCIPGMYL